MDKDLKLQIYQGIIRYILDSTNYSLHNIADLADCSIEDLCAIYSHNRIPKNFLFENQLIKIYQMVLALQPKITLPTTKYLIEIQEIAI